jgi:DNA mismatch repair protein MutS2
VVPFDLELGGDFDVLVVTGPNTGGKTVTLKTVGLLCLMALAAVPAPVASGSRVPFFDAVFADIGDEQDLQQSLSTFSGHLRRIRRILERATARSLVLLDELGTGTDPQEGEALGHALLRSLLERRVRVVATTHLSGLKEMGFVQERVENASLEFDANTLKPLYRLTIGLPGESNALTIARRLGLDPAVIRWAEKRLERGSGEEGRRVREGIQKSRSAALRRLELAEEEARRAEALRSELEARLEEVRGRAEVLEQEKQKEIERLLVEAREKGMSLVGEFGTVPARLAPTVEKLTRFLEELPARSDLAERRARRLRDLRPGERVYLPRYREKCRIRKVDRGRKTITVLYRNMSMEVPFGEVEVPESGSER